MAIQKLNVAAIVEGGTYTPSAGSNRAVVFSGSGESAFSSRPLVGLSFGGAQCTEAVRFGNDGNVKGGIFYILEANIPAGANTLTADWEGDPHESFVGAAYTLTGVDQLAPLAGTDFEAASSVSGVDLAVTSEDGGIVILAAGANSTATNGLSVSSTNTASTITFAEDSIQRPANHEGGSISSLITTGGPETVGVRWASTLNAGASVASFSASGDASGPSLGTVPSTAYPGETITITGTNLTGASADFNGETCSVTVNSATEIEVTIAQGDAEYGSHTLTVTTVDGSDTADIELVADTANGFGFVVMTTPNTTDESSVAFGATPTVVTGDQFEWEDFNALGNLAIGPDAFVSSVDTEGTFRGRFWDASDGTWGAINTFTASATDETAPTISSAAVPTAGNNIAVQMSESMQVGAGGSGGWTISLAGVSVSSASVDGTDDTIVNLTPSRTLTDEDTLTIGYTQPGDGFQDQAATPNDLATLSGQVVTNNSTQQPPDVTGPVTQSVGVPTAGTYAIGDDLSFTVNWDEAVTVTGTPALNLDIGGTSRQADYVSGSGSSALVFTYTVQAGDEDDNGIAVSSLTLEDGTLQDASSNNATLTLNSVGDTSGVLVDGLAPVISINSLTTTDTTPVVTGSSGDATSLTLVVNSVTYNPAPSGGTWSQQLPELALDTYPMTLNGQDAAGNDAVEAQAVLTVVDEIVATGNGLFRPLFRANKKSTFKNLFR